MKLSILAPGGIANQIARAAVQLEGIECYAAASRSSERAEAFADKWGFEKHYGSYGELAEDPQAELVYVASPHSHHYQHAKLCLEHGKHVLQEKAFTVNAAQAEELIQIAGEKGLLLAEAFWPRYMPSRNMIQKLLAQGAIGEVQSVEADFGAPLSTIERLRSPELAGGALLDLGVYPINFALQVFPENIEKIHSSAVLSPEGVDWMNSITLTFEGGKMAVLHSNMLAHMKNHGTIYGDKGYLEVDSVSNCTNIRVYEGNKMTCYQVPEQINGYEYEILACARAIEAGQTECAEMPHSETVRMMRILDEARKTWGMRFPCE